VFFKNHGATAGATLEHPHAQLIALPIVPGFVREELDGAGRYFDAVTRCVFCDLIRQETDAQERVIESTADFLVVSPYASRFPFETWLLPKRHAARFVEYPESGFEHLARALKRTATRIDRALGGPDYNLIVHSSPSSEDTAEFYHWHIEIIPKLAWVAGFEWGTGFYINHTSPEDATRALRSVSL
jgi:UDPglucose--hexose-1-phosphate uridylyltransferase